MTFRWRSFVFTTILVLGVLKLTLAQSTTPDTGGGGGKEGVGDSDTGGGQCIWYGVCNYDKIEQNYQYCNYSGPAKPIESKTRELLQVWCKHLLDDEDGDGIVETCCDAQQVRFVEKFCQGGFSDCLLILTVHQEASMQYQRSILIQIVSTQLSVKIFSDKLKVLPSNESFKPNLKQQFLLVLELLDCIAGTEAMGQMISDERQNL
ncbi:uncharacterized protein LOC129743970 [Uranotaenia lowii]|uniref:uncharacterized protein LOC129743970 n=1 Tax=Uranotaenia lowii TaxID=190385 RepID=UPI002479D17F|nr:uncharacterized protein LOC129743970 [Uranotaenia lowii]